MLMKNYPPAVLDALADRGITINKGASSKSSGIVVSGAGCTWWDGIEKAASLKGTGEHGLPCCPFCGSVLFQHEDEAAYLRGAPEYEADGHPGYVAMLKWARGKCFHDLSEMESTYAAERQQPTDGVRG
jgi:hypothetical protein